MPETFTWLPTVDSSASVIHRIRKAGFGDGYSQSSADGINNRSQSWPVQFYGNEALIGAIMAFLDARKGAESFFWTPPLGVQGYYQATGYAITPAGEGFFTLSATFEQVFRP